MLLLYIYLFSHLSTICGINIYLVCLILFVQVYFGFLAVASEFKVRCECGVTRVRKHTHNCAFAYQLHFYTSFITDD